jgi:hypothetical protein
MNFKALFLSFSIAFCLISSRPASANISLSYLSFKGVMIGLAISGASLGAGYGGVQLVKKKNIPLKILGGSIVVVSAFGLLFGLVGLDGQELQPVQFKQLTEDEAQNLMISDEERHKFNDELDQVHFLIQDISKRLSKLENATGSDAAILWDELKETISPEAFSALVKISNQFDLK